MGDVRGKDYEEKDQKRRWGADSGGVFGQKRGGGGGEKERKKADKLDLESSQSVFRSKKA